MSDTPSNPLTEAPAATAKLVITRGGTVGKEFSAEAAGETLIGRGDPAGGAFPLIDRPGD